MRAESFHQFSGQQHGPDEMLVLPLRRVLSEGPVVSYKRVLVKLSLSKAWTRLKKKFEKT